MKFMAILRCILREKNIGDGRVVSNFIVQALSEKDITIYGDGLISTIEYYASYLMLLKFAKM